MEEKIDKIHQLIKEVFPDAILVEVIVNTNGIEVKPRFRTNVSEYTMQTITGKWINRVKQ